MNTVKRTRLDDAEEMDKGYLSKEQRRLLRRIAEGLGIGKSEVLRQVFMEYAKSPVIYALGFA